MSPKQEDNQKFQAGWGRSAITVDARGYAMHGFGLSQHRAYGQRTPLYARAFCIRDNQQQMLVFCCLDLGYVTHAMRSGAIEQLQLGLGKAFREEAFVLTCTHTHSGPGGCSHDALYNLVTPGFQPSHLQAVIAATVAAVIEAVESLAPTTLTLGSNTFEAQVPVAWNRALRAYNRNSDVTPRRDTETHLALDRRMQTLGFHRNGSLQSLLSLFGVHATCISSHLSEYDGDNKGYASRQAEDRLQASGASKPVAIFAQGTAGDVSPHYHGPGQMARRNKIRGEAEYAYAAKNGEYQSTLALDCAAGGESLHGSIDAILSYVDFSQVHADAQFAEGNEDAWTSEPCHGVSFFTGTPVDGLGMPRPLGMLTTGIARALRKYRLERSEPAEREYYRKLYAAQDPKPVLMESGRKRILGQSLEHLSVPGFVDPLVGELKRQVSIGAIRESALVPTVLPLQIVIIGQLAIVCCPGEFTTTAGKRVRDVVDGILRGRDIRHTLICTYCNDYMGYVTTPEEYREQTYEGGHTIFGKWTLSAFQTRFSRLAAELLKAPEARRHDRTTRPDPAPADELALRSNLPVPA